MRGPSGSLSRRHALKAAGAVIAAGVSATVGHIYTVDPAAEDPDIIGHRGAAGLEPANTLAAIETALEYDVDGVELDVRRTSDGTLVLFHDPLLDWSTDGRGFVNETTWDQLAAVSFHGESIPTLADGLEALEEADVDVYLELKKAGYTAAVIDQVQDFGMLDRTTVLSFKSDALSGGERSDIGTGLLGNTPNSILLPQAEDLGVDVVSTHYTPYGLADFMQRTRDRGFKGGVWHLTETEDVLEDVLEADPDHITTNRPDLAAEVLRQA